MVLTEVVKNNMGQGTPVSERFERLDAEKQQAIINAALAEFAENGYSRASTNEIVKQAGISKGILFHYFGSKRRLFLYLFSWGVSYLTERFEREIDVSNRDVITRLWAAVELKMKVNRTYPTLFAFLQQMYASTPQDILAEIQKTADLAVLDISRRLFSDVDTSLFREGIDISRALSAVRWILEGYGNSVIEQMRQTQSPIDLEEAFAESGNWFRFVRQIFYREEPETAVRDTASGRS